MKDSIYAALSTALPLLWPDVDRLEIERYVDLCEERDQLGRILAEEGAVQTVPIQNNRGQVIGQKREAHPVVSQLRALDRALNDLGTRLGIGARARAALGLTAATADRAEAERMLQELLQ